jgi:hypothetical protein
MAVVGCLVEADAIGARCRSYTPRLVVGVKLEVSNEVT